jgi:hypothetical protein
MVKQNKRRAFRQAIFLITKSILKAHIKPKKGAKNGKYKPVAESGPLFSSLFFHVLIIKKYPVDVNEEAILTKKSLFHDEKGFINLFSRFAQGWMIY